MSVVYSRAPPRAATAMAPQGPTLSRLEAFQQLSLASRAASTPFVRATNGEGDPVREVLNDTIGKKRNPAGTSETEDAQLGANQTDSDDELASPALNETPFVRTFMDTIEREVNEKLNNKSEQLRVEILLMTEALRTNPEKNQSVADTCQRIVQYNVLQLMKEELTEDDLNAAGLQSQQFYDLAALALERVKNKNMRFDQSKLKVKEAELENIASTRVVLLRNELKARLEQIRTQLTEVSNVYDAAKRRLDAYKIVLLDDPQDSKNIQKHAEAEVAATQTQAALEAKQGELRPFEKAVSSYLESLQPTNIQKQRKKRATIPAADAPGAIAAATDGAPDASDGGSGGPAVTEAPVVLSKNDVADVFSSNNVANIFKMYSNKCKSNPLRSYKKFNICAEETEFAVYGDKIQALYNDQIKNIERAIADNDIINEQMNAATEKAEKAKLSNKKKIPGNIFACYASVVKGEEKYKNMFLAAHMAYNLYKQSG
jgi:hypothetical protein